MRIKNKKNTQNILIVVFLIFTIFLLLILIIWWGVYNVKYYVIYDGRNPREYDANRKLSYAKNYFNYTDVKASRHIYYKGTDLNYLYKMKLFGNGTIKYLVTTENYLYNIATTKIENNSKIKYLLYSEQLNKMAIIYENGELFEFESFEI